MSYDLRLVYYVLYLMTCVLCVITYVLQLMYYELCLMTYVLWLMSYGLRLMTYESSKKKRQNCSILNLFHKIIKLKEFRIYRHIHSVQLKSISLELSININANINWVLIYKKKSLLLECWCKSIIKVDDTRVPGENYFTTIYKS